MKHLTKCDNLIKSLLLLPLFLASFLIAEPIKVTKNDRGIIRSLKVYKYPRWIAQITTSQDKKLYFSSAKSMFEFYFLYKRWPEFNVKTVDDMAEIFVTDFKTYDAINARRAYYVYGSNITSIAGDDLISFKNEYDAKEYSKEHNGKRIFRFSQVKHQLIELLNGSI
jgi:nitrous oxide reductase accessory protein NosL